MKVSPLGTLVKLFPPVNGLNEMTVIYLLTDFWVLHHEDDMEASWSSLQVADRLDKLLDCLWESSALQGQREFTSLCTVISVVSRYAGCAVWIFTEFHLLSLHRFKNITDTLA